MMFSGGKAPANIEFFERKNSTMKKLNKKGFTIVELVIVIAVIAILAGVLIPTFATVVDKANQSKAMQEAKNEYEAYLAEYAKDLDGTQDFDIVSGKYCFEVRDGKFDATAKDVPAKYSDTDNLVDQSKVYVAVNDSKGQYNYENGLYVKAAENNGKYNLASGENTDLGSDKVAIYAVTTP